MWYFSWVLGTGFACFFGVLNAMWLELREKEGSKHQSPDK